MAFESIVKFKTILKQNSALLSCTRTVGPPRKDGTLPGVLSVRLDNELLEKLGRPDDSRFDVLFDMDNGQGMLKGGDVGFKLMTNKKGSTKRTGFISFTMPEFLEYIPKDTAGLELRIVSISNGCVVFDLPKFDSQPAVEVNQAIW